MYNYSMYSPMMYGSSMGNMYGTGNAYINMRSQYGYPYTRLEYPQVPMNSVIRDKHAIVERNRFLNFLKKLF